MARRAPNLLDEYCRARRLDAGRVRPRLQAAAAIFDASRHLHGLTKTARTWLELVTAMRLAAPAQSDLRMSGPTELAEELASDLPPMPPEHRRVVTRALELTMQRELAAPASRSAPAAEQAIERIASRVAAIVRLVAEFEDSQQVCGVWDDGRALRVVISANGQPLPPSTIRRDVQPWNLLMLRPAALTAAKAADCRGSEAPPLVTAKMTAAQAGVAILRRQVEHLLALAGGVAFEADTEYVHEMRVVMRRIRSAARLFGKVFGSRLAEMVEQLKAYADDLGAVRDEDVFIDFLLRRVDAATADRPVLQRLLQQRRQWRERLFAKAVQAVQSREFQSAAKAWMAMLAAAPGSPHGLDCDAERARRPAAAFASRRLRRQLGKVLAYDEPLRTYSPSQQHKLRIQFKRLRYAGEFFGGLFRPALARDLIAPAKELQDLLGEAHDAVVFDGLLKAHAARQRSPDARKAIESQRGWLTRHHKTLLSRAAKLMAKFAAAEGKLRKMIDGPETRA